MHSLGGKPLAGYNTGDMGTPKELVVATNNPHKIRELRRLFPGVRLLSPADLGTDFVFEEAGSSYLENSLGKARHLQARVLRPVLADDSGLEVPALGGEPGLFSSRYGSPPGGGRLTDAERCQILLGKAEKLTDRACFFVCCMALAFDQRRFVAAQEVFPGQLARAPRGTGGFGYDPIVYVPEAGRTVAELSDRQKDRLSHRGRAARRIRALLARGWT
jgi:XTP/dITP diphosphohydrolase